MCHYKPNSINKEQGTVLVALLFTIFINDLPDRICSSYLFYCSCTHGKVLQTVEKVNADLHSIAVWAKS